MRGQTVVLDSSNLAAIVADATGEPLEAPAAEPKEEKVEIQAEEAGKQVQTPTDEDENGLTDEERRELTTKMQKAIGKKHRALKEAEEFAAAQYSERRLAEERAERLQRELNRFQNQTQATENQPQKASGAPSRNQFESDEDYQNAMIDWRVEQRLRVKDEQDQQRRESERYEEIRQKASERISAARELIPDFEEKLEENDAPIPAHIASYMQESEMIAELAYFLANNRDRLDKISKMSPSNALVEIGKIESKLEPFGKIAETKVVKTSDGEKPSNTQTAPGPRTEKPPRADAPITPISTSSVSQVEKLPNEMNIRETISDWSKKNRVNFSRRQRH